MKIEIIILLVKRTLYS